MVSEASLQARACWQWNNFYHAVIPAGKQILRLGLDETSIQCYGGKSFGCVFPHAGKQRQAVKQNLPKQKRRKCLTLIVTVADDAMVQNLLPTFLIGNFNAFLQRDMPSLRNAAGPRVELIRCRSAGDAHAEFYVCRAGRTALGIIPTCLIMLYDACIRY